MFKKKRKQVQGPKTGGKQDKTVELDLGDDTEVDLNPVEGSVPGSTATQSKGATLQFSSSENVSTDPIYNFLLIASLIAFISVILLAGVEAHDFYDVAFFFFKK